MACKNCGHSNAEELVSSTNGEQLCIQCQNAIAFMIPRPGSSIASKSGNLPYSKGLSATWAKHGKCNFCDQACDLAPVLPNSDKAAYQPDVRVAICGPCLERLIRASIPVWERRDRSGTSPIESFFEEYFSASWDDGIIAHTDLQWDAQANEWRGDVPERRHRAMREIWEDGKVKRIIGVWFLAFLASTLGYAITFGLIESLVGWMTGSKFEDWHFILRAPFYIVRLAILFGTAGLLWQYWKAQLDQTWRDKSDDEVIEAAADSKRRRGYRTIVTAVVIVGLCVLLAKPAISLLAFATSDAPPVASGLRGAIAGTGNVLQLQNQGNTSLTASIAVVPDPDSDDGLESLRFAGIVTGVIGVETVGKWSLPPGSIVELGPADGLALTESDIAVVFVDGFRPLAVSSASQSD